MGTLANNNTTYTSVSSYTGYAYPISLQNISINLERPKKNIIVLDLRDRSNSQYLP